MQIDLITARDAKFNVTARETVSLDEFKRRIKADEVASCYLEEMLYDIAEGEPVVIDISGISDDEGNLYLDWDNQRDEPTLCTVCTFESFFKGVTHINITETIKLHDHNDFSGFESLDDMRKHVISFALQQIENANTLISEGYFREDDDGFVRIACRLR